MIRDKDWLDNIPFSAAQSQKENGFKLRGWGVKNWSLFLNFLGFLYNWAYKNHEVCCEYVARIKIKNPQPTNKLKITDYCNTWDDSVLELFHKDLYKLYDLEDTLEHEGIDKYPYSSSN